MCLALTDNFILSKINNFPFLTLDLTFISIYSGFSIEDLLTVSDCARDKTIQCAHSWRVMLMVIFVRSSFASGDAEPGTDGTAS